MYSHSRMASNHRQRQSTSRRELADADCRTHTMLVDDDLEKITTVLGTQIKKDEVVGN